MATIDTNMSLVMIDPNEPLELYDGTIIKGRLEWFLYALCCLDYGNLPTPLSRIEEWANALITNELPNMEPQSRAEEFFKAILTGDTSNLPTPQSRSEVLLDKLARGENDFTNVEKIQSRYEFLLAYLIKNGGGIGNIDYVLYKFQKEDETLYNTKERPVKSAILKGQTLVNLVPSNYSIDIQGITTAWQHSVFLYLPNKGSGYDVESLQSLQSVKSNAKYLLRFYVERNTVNNKFALNNPSDSSVFSTYVGVNAGETGWFNFILTSKEIVNESIVIRFQNATAINGDIKVDKIMLIEYVEGMENWDIPYFEGMQSVKMPGLTTTGKNLVGKLMYGSVSTGGNIADNMNQKRVRTDYINIQNEEKITIKTHSGEVNQNISFFYDENKKFISQTSWNPSITNSNGLTILIPSNAKYVICEFTHNLPSDKDLVLSNIKVQIEKGDTATFYEPYKSNILTTPSDLELRGIGDVKDTLDCLTGEVVERIGEIVFDGNANEQWKLDGWWVNKNDTIGFETISPAFLSDRIICETVTVSNYSGLTTKDKRAIAYSVEYGVVMLRLLRTELATQDLKGLKQWLSQNPIVIQYQLATPTVKTVDLTITDQGGATIPKLKTFDKITHVNVSATDILPGVEMEVATTIGEDLSGTLYSTMEDIETKQEALKESNNAQTESINSTMMATTEIYESLL